jgi:UPF0042 nucleotide-binding protein
MPDQPPHPTPEPATEPRDVIVVTGISGSGKSVALHALEDAGFYCVDNLPPELLRGFLELDARRFGHRVAIAVDARSARSLPQLAPTLRQLQAEGLNVRLVFLDATTDALVRRFSETRRPHPLSKGDAGDRLALIESIDAERALLAELREASTVVDTSQLKPAQLRQWVRELVRSTEDQLTLVFESFAFKHGVPLDADFVFDVRVLPNPFYVKELKSLTGRDAPVAEFLGGHSEVGDMAAQIEQFVAHWLPAFERDQRHYLTVAIGCTGGQHRSVYLVEQLARRFAMRATTLVRHRELAAPD